MIACEDAVSLHARSIVHVVALVVPRLPVEGRAPLGSAGVGPPCNGLHGRVEDLGDLYTESGQTLQGLF